jgi:hypothetical protein
LLDTIAFEVLFDRAAVCRHVPEDERAAWRALYHTDPDVVLDLLAHSWNGSAAA